MRFNREPRYTLRPVSGRRLAAAKRALQREADAVALFPELQPTETPEARIARFEDASRIYWQRVRNHTAATWRHARAQFRTLTPVQREQVLQRWNSPNWHPPHEAHYFADLVHTAAKL